MPQHQTKAWRWGKRRTHSAPAQLRLTAEKQKGKIFNIFLMRAPDKIFSIKERKFFLFAFLLMQKSAVASRPLCPPSADFVLPIFGRGDK